MRIAICDDERYIIDSLKKLILSYFAAHKLDKPNITCFLDGIAMLADSDTADIVLLDIDMPGMNGISVAEQLKQRNPDVIIMIITSHMQYLDNAMKINVFRYISKPIDINRLYDNLGEAYKAFHTCHNSIKIKSNEQHVIIHKSDIIFVETNRRGTLTHTIHGSYSSNMSINQWHSELTNICFFQTHQSYIVNLEYVHHYDGSTIHFLGTDDTAMISRRNIQLFNAKLTQYLENMR